MTDADLNALFAVHVAGWEQVGMVALVGPGDPMFYEVPGEREWRNAEQWTASMDAVLPYMEKLEKENTFWVAGSDRVKQDWVASHDRNDVGGIYCALKFGVAGRDDIWAWSDSLPRACVLALLRAAGVAV